MVKHHKGERKAGKTGKAENAGKKSDADDTIQFRKSPSIKKWENVAEYRRTSGAFAFLSDSRFLIVALFLFSLIIRIAFVNAGIPHFDSIADANKAPLTLETGKLQYSYGYGAPGIVVLLTGIYAVDHLITGAENAEFAYFFITILSAALSIALLYLIVEKLSKNKLAAFLSSLFFSITPIYLSITTYPKTHSPAIAFALLGGYLLLRAAEDSSLKWIVLSGLCFSFAISIRIFSVFFIVPFALFYINPRMDVKSKRLLLNKGVFSLKTLAAFIISAGAVVFALFIPKISERGFAGFINSLLAERGTAALQQALEHPFLYAFSELRISLTFFGFIAAALGAIYMLKEKKYLIFASTLLWFLLFFVYFSRLQQGEVARFLTESLIPFMIFAGFGVYFLAELSAVAVRMLGHRPAVSQTAIIAVALGVLLSAAMFSNIYPILKARHDYSGQKEFALWVGSFAGDSSVLITNDEGFFYTFYTGKKFIGHYYDRDDQELIAFLEKIAAMLQAGTEVYISDSGFGIRPDVFASALQQNFDITYIGAQRNEFYSRNTLHFQYYPEPGERLFRIKMKESPAGQANVASANAGPANAAAQESAQ